MTQSDRFAARFAVLAQKKEGAFVPFVNLCDPTPEISSQILEALAAGGADALELGIPFSDPCADGPVIEASAQRALAAGSTTAKCLGIIKAFRAKHPDIPVSLMLYVNLVTAPGVENFFAAAKDAGVDAVLIPDVPISMREAEPEWDAAAKAHGIHLIAIAICRLCSRGVRLKRITEKEPLRKIAEQEPDSPGALAVYIPSPACYNIFISLPGRERGTAYDGKTVPQ